MKGKLHLRGKEISWSLYDPECGSLSFGIEFAHNYKYVTCGRCKNTKKYKKLKEESERTE